MTNKELDGSLVFGTRSSEAMQSYDYARRQGIEDINWEQFYQLSQRLAEAVAARGVDLVVGVARTGLFPATAVACMLRCEFYPVRVTRRANDQVVSSHPVWKVPVPNAVQGQRVAVIDEIADTGETLALVAEAVRARGAVDVVTACLAAHSWARPMPDLVALVSDALVLFPWDRQVYAEGRWGPHPELVAALGAQGLEPSSLLS